MTSQLYYFMMFSFLHMEKKNQNQQLNEKAKFIRVMRTAQMPNFFRQNTLS